MENILVGCTGFVGGNLAAEFAFDGQYHSTDVQQAYGTKPRLLVYAGLPAAKYLANTDPEADLAVCRRALENIRAIAPQRLVLISTVDVYGSPAGVDENDAADLRNPQAYGRNRALLEEWVRAEYPGALIVRLPGLYGKGLKKNFLFDLHTVTPFMLKEEKYRELAEKSPLVRAGYAPAANGFYRLNGAVDACALRAFFEANDFNALCFTDSRAAYQFYDLGRLWKDVCAALEAGLTLLNLATPPVTAAEIYTAVTGRADWRNCLPGLPAAYDMRSLHAETLGGAGGYLCSKEEELRDIAAFMENWLS